MMTPWSDVPQELVYTAQPPLFSPLSPFNFLMRLSGRFPLLLEWTTTYFRLLVSDDSPFPDGSARCFSVHAPRRLVGQDSSHSFVGNSCSGPIRLLRRSRLFPPIGPFLRAFIRPVDPRRALSLLPGFSWYKEEVPCFPPADKDGFEGPFMNSSGIPLRPRVPPP